jgi:membrane protein
MLERFKIPISWGDLFTRTFKEAWADDVLNLAAQQAYYFFFALFPAILALISIVSFFPIENLMDEIVAMLSRVAPGDVTRIVTDQIRQISNTNAGGILTFAFLFTLWSSSNAVLSMTSTLNTAYDITEGRAWWRVRLTALGLTLGLALFVLMSMTLVVAGPAIARKIADAMNFGSAFVSLWSLLQWPIVFVLVATAIALIYYYAPDAEQDWVWITPGSVVATLLWLVVSLGFKLYVARFGTYNETYGVIGGVMVLMLWFYLSGVAILMGAELNAEIEHVSPYGKDVGEKVPGEKKRIGPMAARAYEEKRKRGEIPVVPFSDDENCDIDRRARPVERPPMKPSDALIGAAVLVPAAVRITKAVKKRLDRGAGNAAGKNHAA